MVLLNLKSCKKVNYFSCVIYSSAFEILNKQQMLVANAINAITPSLVIYLVGVSVPKTNVFQSKLVIIL